LEVELEVERLELLRLDVLPGFRRGVLFFRSANCHLSLRVSIDFRQGPSRSRRSGQPPMGALGLAPQKTRVPIIPMMCTRTMFKTIDFAVAVPTPTGPPEAV
jgi:hypothetical protein